MQDFIETHRQDATRADYVYRALEALDDLARDFWPDKTRGVRDPGVSDDDLAAGLLAALKAHAVRMTDRYGSQEFHG
jgi:hypothetical protein